MRRWVLPVILRLTLGIIVISAFPAANAAHSSLEQQFAQTVQPFVAQYCIGCHSGKTPAAQFDLKAYSTMDTVVRDYPRWALVLEKLTAKEMPPKAAAAARREPPAGDRLDRGDAHGRGAKERRRSGAGAGAAVEQRRVQLHHPRPHRRGHSAHARVSGRSRQPSRLRQLRRVADHVAGAAEEVSAGGARSRRSHGAQARRHSTSLRIPMLVETDRDKYAIQRIVDFYERQPTDYADYFQAAWRFKHRAALGKPKATLAAIAADAKVSAKYLPMVWQILEESPRQRSRKSARSPNCRRCGGLCRRPARRISRMRSARSASRCATSWSASATHTADAVRGAGRARICPPVAAADELEAARVRLAPPRFRPATLCAWRATRRLVVPRSRTIPACSREAALRVRPPSC